MSQPPPLPQRPQVDVWEYLGDGLWSSLGQAFPEPMTDPFWIMCVRILPWWPEGHANLNEIALEEESSYSFIPSNA